MPIGPALDKITASDEKPLKRPSEVEDKYRPLFDGNVDGVLLMRPDGRIVAANPAACRMLEMTPEEVCAAGCEDIIDISDHGRKTAGGEELLTGTLEGEIDFIRRDGSKIRSETSSIAFKDAPGQDWTYIIFRDATGVRRVKDGLCEENYRLWFEAIPQLAWYSALLGEGTTCNRRWCEYTGQTPEEARGRGWMRALHPDDLNRVARKVADDMAGGEVYQTEYRLRRASDGEYRWHLARALPVRDRDGQIIGWFGTATDIEEQKQAEEKLHRSRDELEKRVLERTAELEEANRALKGSRDFLNKIINSIGDPIFVKDREHRQVLVNDAACRLFGRPRDEIIGQTAYDLFPSKETADISWEKDEEVFRTGEENVNEETNTYSPGVTRTVLVKKALYTDDAGNRFLVGITRDITDYKQAQEQVRFQASLLDQVHNAVIATDLKGNIVYWNNFARALLLWSAEEVLGRSIADTVVPAGKQDIMSEVISELHRAGYYEGEFNLRRKDGSTVPTFHTFSAIRDIQGKPIGFVGVATDITDRKRTEKELLIAKEAAELASRAKSDFLANMSHEIRTPMNAVIGLTGLLLGTDLTEEQKDYVETIRISGGSLLSIINNILDFSKIESGKMELESQPLDLRSCMEESLDLVATKASEKGLSLVYRIDEDIPEMIMGDPIRLQQILINLLANAVKFTDAGEVTASADALRLDGSICEIHFAIKDTGIGIPEDKIGSLFESFSQVDASTSRKYGGTGLGLAISRRLVEIMGGRIWVESEVGRGSTFHFTIKAEATSCTPVAPVDAMVSRTSKASRAEKEKETGTETNTALRILLAEDNSINQKVMLRMLQKLGYTADVAGSGFDVLQALEHEHYDLILMDIQMPEMDGFEATRIIREMGGDQPRIVAITAYALAGDRDRCLEAGMDDYLPKPVNMEDIERILNKYHYKS